MDEKEITLAATEPHTDGVLLKKILFAIIKANPDSSGTKSDKKRMNAAMGALLGSKYKSDKVSEGTFEALKWMAEEYISDRGGPGLSPGSDSFAWLHKKTPNARGANQLAEEAKSKHSTPCSTRNLENVFSEQRVGICKAVVLGSDIPSLLHHQALLQIRDILAPLGVPMNIDDKQPSRVSIISSFF